MNLDNIGIKVATIKDNPTEKNTFLCVASQQEAKKNPKVEYYQKIELEEDEGEFVYVPDKKRDRVSMYVVGKNGSGKSYYIKEFLKYFIKIYPKSPIYLVSSKNADKNFNDIKIIRVDVSDIVDNPIDYESFPEDSMVIFDDIDAYTGKQKRAVYDLRDIILKNGRSYRINIIVTSHEATGTENQAPLNESDAIVFFLQNYNRKLKYLCENYIGLEPKQLNILKKSQSRATTYVKTFPNIIIQEKLISTFEGILNNDST